MQVSTSVACHHDDLEGCLHQVNVRDNWTRSNASWKSGGLGHFQKIQKDCKATLNPQGDDWDDAALSDTIPTISKMGNTLTASMPITNLTFKAVLKELISSAFGNWKAFCPKPQTTPMTSVQPTTIGVSLPVTPVVTAAPSISSHLTTSCSLEQIRKKRDTKAPIPGRILSEGDSVLLKDHTTGVWDSRYIRNYQIAPFPGKTQVELVDSRGKVKIVHISDVKYVLSADRVTTKLPNFQSFSRQLKLRIDPKDIPNLKWEPTVTVKTIFDHLFKDK